MKIAKESFPIAVVFLAVAIALGLLWHPLACLPGMLLVVFTIWFFRDPERSVPVDPLATISPADGRVIKASSNRVSIFMNVFNVHICRAPVAGQVESVKQIPGSFLSAFKDAASEHNERTTIVLVQGARRTTFTLVAGLIARRIVCKVAVGQQLAAGERVGLIQFGSRVDVDLPKGSQAVVVLNQKVVAGETVIAREPPGPA